MSELGKAVGLLSLMSEVIPHEIDQKKRDADCIKLCQN